MGMMLDKHTPDYHDIGIAWDNAISKGIFSAKMPMGGYGYEYIGNNGKGFDKFRNLKTKEIMLVPIWTGL